MSVTLDSKYSIHMCKQSADLSVHVTGLHPSDEALRMCARACCGCVRAFTSLPSVTQSVSQSVCLSVSLSLFV